MVERRSEIAARGRRGRPLVVTVVVGVVALAGLLDVALAALVAVGTRTEGGSDAVPDGTVPVGAVVVVLGGLGIAQLVLALLLARGRNSARLVLTLVLVLRQAYGWYLVADLTDRWPIGVLTLAATTLTLLLLWNRSASAFFEQDRERALADSLAGQRTKVGRRRRSGALLLDYAARLAVLAITVAVTPGVYVETWASLLLAVAGISLAAWALTPLLGRVAGLFGWIGALLLALFANAAVIGAGLWVTPGVVVTSVGGAVLASWVYALVMTVLTWLVSVDAQDYLTVHATRMSLRGGPPERSDVPGVLFVQLDGVPAPLLENEVRAGNLPTISRWIRSGSHTWREWTARVPSTTPVSQAGLLHGDTTGIPAFRWYDRELGRLVVANRPADAALIEARRSDGHGLLADDGVSVSNLFSGDAPVSLLSMSGLREPRQGLGPSRSYAAFFTHPAGFMRAVILTVGEMAKEIFQARRQVRRGIEPRIDRHGSYVALRAVTNVFLRDLNVALVIEAMMRGAKSIYVDFVDYDEIAHHAGVTRPESLASLYGLDEVLAGLEQVAGSGATPRPYEIVLVSDHGQTFRQRYGQTLEELVAAHMSGPGEVAAATAEVEAYGPVNVLLGQLSRQDSVSGRLTRRAMRDRDRDNPLGPSARSGDASTQQEQPPLVVVGSGNLGGVWFAQHDHRLTLEEIERLHPGLVQALADHEGIGFVVVMTGGGPVAVGRSGTQDLTTGDVVGSDPLAGFGADAREDFLRVASFDDAPDVYVNSLYDPVLDEVAAFEELVGCHGGLGGWQTRPILVHPAAWAVDADLLDEQGRLRGAETVHRQLVRWLERLGHRADLPGPGTRPGHGAGVPSPRTEVTSRSTPVE